MKRAWWHIMWKGKAKTVTQYLLYKKVLTTKVYSSEQSKENDSKNESDSPKRKKGIKKNLKDLEG